MKKIIDIKSIRRRNLLFAATVVILSFFLIYSYVFEDVRDAKTLGLKAAKALENTDSYRFDISSNLSMFNEELQIIKVEGEVDSIRNKMRLSLKSQDRSVEAIVLRDKTYAREIGGEWQVRTIDDMSIWKDKLGEQRLILKNAANSTMYKENGMWLLEIVPEKADILEQMRDAGLDDSKIELKKYVMRYWIDPRTYYTHKSETYADIEMNFRGMQTSMKLMNVIHFSGFNEKMNIEAPV